MTLKKDGRSTRPASYRWLLTLSAGALGWAVVVFVTGGFELAFGERRLSSTNAERPFWIAGAALAARYLLTGSRRLREDLVSLERGLVRSAPVLAGLGVAVALLVGIGYGTFTAGGADSSGHVSQAGLWLSCVAAARSDPRPDRGRRSVDSPWLLYDGSTGCHPNWLGAVHDCSA